MKRAFFVVSASAVVLFAGSPADAAPPEFPHGVGVCVSQVAIRPDFLGLERLGDFVQSVAAPGTQGSGVPAFFDLELRGDGPGGCGQPPGPGHLP